jgi:TRAP-type uncharacterized transport system fused permease subunit
MAEIYRIIDKGAAGVQNARSYKFRAQHWDHVLDDLDKAGLGAVLLGRGPHKSYSAVNDNDYIATLVHYGAIGSTLYYFLWMGMAVLAFMKRKHDPILGDIVLIYLGCLMLMGVTSESFSSWILPLPALFIFGALTRSQNPNDLSTRVSPSSPHIL